jgi:hypothetical protein
VKLEEQFDSGCSNFPNDSLYFRFTFESDSTSDSLAGWMIRNLVIGGSDVGGAVIDAAFQQAVSLSPNPSSDFISITSAELKLLNAKIFNTYGQLIFNNKITSSALNISALLSGIYTLELETNNGVVRKKMVKE